jgi:hypothetical protein
MGVKALGCYCCVIRDHEFTQGSGGTRLPRNVVKDLSHQDAIPIEYDEASACLGRRPRYHVADLMAWPSTRRRQ